VLILGEHPRTLEDHELEVNKAVLFVYMAFCYVIRMRLCGSFVCIGKASLVSRLYQVKSSTHGPLVIGLEMVRLVAYLRYEDRYISMILPLCSVLVRLTTFRAFSRR